MKSAVSNQQSASEGSTGKDRPEQSRPPSRHADRPVSQVHDLRIDQPLQVAPCHAHQFSMSAGVECNLFVLRYPGVDVDGNLVKIAERGVVLCSN